MRSSQRTQEALLPAHSLPGETFTRIFLTIDAATVIMLAFLFAFGNGWRTALLLGVNPWIAPLIQPAVDLAVVGLMVALRYLAAHGWTDEQLTKPRRWLRTFGLMTLGMNTGLPLYQHQWGRATWDCIGPILLIAWSELGPWLLRAIYSVRVQRVQMAIPTVMEVVEEPAPEVEGEPQPAVEPAPIDTNVLPLPSDATSTREIVRHHLIAWSHRGLQYEDEPAAALHKQLLALGSMPDGRKVITRERVGQLCREEWPRLREQGLLKIA